jgi:hypothetical protein
MRTLELAVAVAFHSHINSRHFDIPNLHSAYAKLVNPSDGGTH